MQEQLISSLGDKLGKFMLGFSIWLNHEVMYSKPSRVLFASREGWFIGKCWEILNNRTYQGQICYIRTGRRVLRLSAVNNLKDMEQLLLIPNNNCSLAFFVQERFGVDLWSDKYIKEVQKVGFSSPNEIINRRRDMNKLIALLPYIAEDHLNYVNRLQYLAGEYYRSFDIENGCSFLVDIGYNGTFNKGLSALLPSATIMGKYIATFDGVIDPNKDKGWLYNQINNRLKNNPLSRNVPMLEHLMMSNSGSLFDFLRNNDNIVPQLKNSPSNEQFAVIHKIQDAALDYISRNIDTISSYKNRNIKKFVSPLFDFLDNPTVEEIQIFGNHFLEDDYGGNEARKLFPDELPRKNTVRQELNLILSYGWSGATDVLIRQQRSFWQRLYRPLWMKFLALKRMRRVKIKSRIINTWSNNNA